MIDLGENHPNYVKSTILTKRIKEFHENCKELLPLLQKECDFYEINTDQEIDQSMHRMYTICQPCIINVRVGLVEHMQQTIIETLCNNDFINLDITELQTAEMERKTPIGQELFNLLKNDKSIPA